MKILLVRHGETDYNKNMLIQGNINIPLNENGINQAIEASNKLNGYKIDFAYSSTLDRAYDTCRYMLDNSGNTDLVITKDERIVEKSFGAYEGVSFDDWYKGQEEKRDLDTVELDKNVERRMTDFFEDIYKKCFNKTVLVVCHGACIRIFLNNKNLIQNNELLKNTALNELDYDGKDFKLLKYNV